MDFATKPVALTGAHAMKLSQEAPRRSKAMTADVGDRRFKKTTLCRFFSKGGCDRGDRCQFAHGFGELRSKPDLRKTALCALWAKGACPNDAKDCAWAHGAHELQDPPQDVMVGASSARRSGRQHEDFVEDDLRSSSLNIDLGACLRIDSSVSFPMRPRAVGLVGVPPLAMGGCKQCPQSLAASARFPSSRFGTGCGSKLTGRSLYHAERGGAEKELADEASTDMSSTPRSNQGSTVGSSDGYDSDEEAFFARRDALYVVNQSQDLHAHSLKDVKP